jgi:cytochrome d ubiquinol oxidase subunit I
VGIVFWAFRVMVFLGVLMAVLGAVSLVARARAKLYEWRGLHGFALAMAPSGLVAVLAGWVTTEVGRQPWTVHGLLRTAASASPVAAPAVATSLLTFLVVYFAIFGGGVIYIIKLVAKPLAEREPESTEVPSLVEGAMPSLALLPGRPVSERGYP